MKCSPKMILAVLCLLGAKLGLANAIDELQSLEDVQKFLVEKVNPSWKGHSLIEAVANDTAAYGKGKFFKLDLDNNGLSDLLINGTYLFAVTDLGDGRYESHFLDRGMNKEYSYALLRIIYTAAQPQLLIQGRQYAGSKIVRRDKTDTLIFRFGDFIEYTAKPDTLQITSILLKANGCNGRCPVFELSIEGRLAKYQAVKYNERLGAFRTAIDPVTFSRLQQTIQYLHLPNLKENYAVSWPDDQTVILVVRYSNGQLKKITDYGALGSFGLGNLYKQLFELRNTLRWQ